MPLWDSAVLLILVYFVIRDIIHIVSTQKLVNKVMSRNYHDYEFSKNVEKTMERDSTTLKDGIKQEEGLKEDLAIMDGF